MRITYFPLLILLAISSNCLIGCGEKEEQKEPPPPKVTVSQPLVHDVIEWDEYIGRLSAVNSVEVRSRVSGYLKSTHFEDGDIVDKGQLLFVIDPRPFRAELQRARGELKRIKARSKLAKDNLIRAKQLWNKGIISEQEFETSETNSREADASLQEAEAAVDEAMLDLEFSRIKAPITGRISRKLVTEGNLVEGGSAESTLLTTIVSLDPIYVYFEVDESSYLDYSSLWSSGKAEFTEGGANPVYLALSNQDGFPHKGRLNFVDNQIDSDTATMTLRAVIPNPAYSLTPGLFARVRLQGHPRYEAKLIPEEAIGTDQSQTYVYVVNDQNKVEYRKVKLGPEKGGFRVILEGITTKDWIIIKGIQRARPGAKVTPERQKIKPPPDSDFLTPDTATAADGGMGG